MGPKDLELACWASGWATAFLPPSTGSWPAMTTGWWSSPQRRWSHSSGRGGSAG